MISYETYKILHVFTLLMVVSAMGGIVAEGRWLPNKTFKIVVGILSFLIFVGGMGLIARLGFTHGQSFPLAVRLSVPATQTSPQPRKNQSRKRLPCRCSSPESEGE